MGIKVTTSSYFAGTGGVKGEEYTAKSDKIKKQKQDYWGSHQTIPERKYGSSKSTK